MPYYRFKFEGQAPVLNTDDPDASELVYNTVSFSEENIDTARQHFDNYVAEQYPELFDIEIINIEEIND
jgi:hypothetical protein